jgi:hypothetical protein
MAKFANHMNESVWKTLAWHSKIACKAYAGEWALKATGDRLQGPRYLSREDHELNIGLGHKEQILGNILL